MRGFDNKDLNSFFLIPKLVIVFKAYYVHKYRIMNTCICKNISVNMTVCIKFLIKSLNKHDRHTKSFTWLCITFNQNMIYFCLLRRQFTWCVRTDIVKYLSSPEEISGLNVQNIPVQTLIKHMMSLGIFVMHLLSQEFQLLHRQGGINF